jgi:hypothetical protein
MIIAELHCCHSRVAKLITEGGTTRLEKRFKRVSSAGGLDEK